MHLCIDGDVLVYESAFGAQRTHYHYRGSTWANAKDCKTWCDKEKLNYKELRKDGSITTSVDLMGERLALKVLDNKLQAILRSVPHTTYELCMTGKAEPNFRDEVATIKPYKGNRVADKPIHYQLIWDKVASMSTVVEGEEADDYMGYRATELGNNNVIIASIDKDMRMIWGRHYEWHNDAKFKVAPEQSRQWFLMQMLMGDKADNIPGIKRYGEKRAREALTEGDVFETIEQAYIEQYGEEEAPYALNEVGRLLWIRRERGQVFDWDQFRAGQLTEGRYDN